MHLACWCTEGGKRAWISSLAIGHLTTGAAAVRKIPAEPYYACHVMKSISEILKEKSAAKPTKYRYEFQVYGDRLAHELGDLSHLSLYMKLAKTLDRNLLEKARERVKEARNLRSKNGRAKLFMWLLAMFRREKSDAT